MLLVYIYHLVHYIEPLGGVSNNSRAGNLLSAVKVDPRLFELTFIQSSHYFEVFFVSIVFSLASPYDFPMLFKLIRGGWQSK